MSVRQHKGFGVQVGYPPPPPPKTLTLRQADLKQGMVLTDLTSTTRHVSIMDGYKT